MPTDQFDVFLSHNSKDKPSIRELYNLLESIYDLQVWYDEEELPPGVPWQPLLEKGIKNSKAVIVAIGNDGLGPWEDQEMQAALTLAVSDGTTPVIPTLLPAAPQKPQLPMFLANRTWVDFRGGFTDEKLDKLVWGITGVKPKSDKKSRVDAASQQTPTPSKPSRAAQIWIEKRDYLLEQQAVIADPTQKFAIKKQLEECERKIAELGGGS